MPKLVPDYLAKMLNNLTYGEAEIGKSGNLILTRSEDGRYATVRHFGTLTLWLDFWKEGENQVVFHYGQSSTDARILNAVFGHFNLKHKFSAHYGKTNGWSLVYHGDEKPKELPYMERGTFDREVKVAEVGR